jgi:hypothetical protein
MQGVVIGGVASGTLIRSLKIEAKTIELARPTHVKPLEHPTDEIKTAKETDVYNVCVFYLPGEDGRVLPFALCILDGQTPAWGMSQLVAGFMRHQIDLIKEELIQT